jgi:hypothetical protein
MVQILTPGDREPLPAVNSAAFAITCWLWLIAFSHRQN